MTVELEAAHSGKAEAFPDEPVSPPVFPAPLLGGPLAEYMGEQIPRIARQVHARYRYVPCEDYEQAMWLAVLSNPDRWKTPFDKGELWVCDRRLRGAAGAATREDDRYRRAARAAELGYGVDDEEYYAPGLLALLLPVLIESMDATGEFDIPAAMQRATGGTDAAGIHIRSNDPFGGGENYQAMLIDVKTAFNGLPEGQQRLLLAYYGVRQDDTEDGRWERDGLASSMGLTAEALRQRAFRALRRMSDDLGGSSPWR